MSWFKPRRARKRFASRTPLGLTIEGLERRQLLTNFEVTNNIDETNANDNLLSLREAINEANANTGPDTITFNSSLAGKKILLQLGELQITDPVTITALSALNSVIDAQRVSRVFNIKNTAGDVTLQGMTITNGLTTSDDSAGSGAGAGGGILFSSSGTLTLIDTAVNVNATTGLGDYGAGIATSSGNILLIGSTVSGNSTGAQMLRVAALRPGLAASR
jgi:hypothetical protein